MKPAAAIVLMALLGPAQAAELDLDPVLDLIADLDERARSRDDRDADLIRALYALRERIRLLESRPPCEGCRVPMPPPPAPPPEETIPPGDLPGPPGSPEPEPAPKPPTKPKTPEKKPEHPTISFRNLGTCVRSLTVQGIHYRLAPGELLTLRPDPGTVRATYQGRHYRWRTDNWKGRAKRIELTR